jgi:hypothetical protein
MELLSNGFSLPLFRSIGPYPISAFGISRTKIKDQTLTSRLSCFLFRQYLTLAFEFDATISCSRLSGRRAAWPRRSGDALGRIGRSRCWSDAALRRQRSQVRILSGAPDLKFLLRRIHHDASTAGQLLRCRGHIDAIVGETRLEGARAIRRWYLLQALSRLGVDHHQGST